LALPVEKILQEVKVQEEEIKQLRYDLAKMVWHMRGGLSYDDAFMLSPEDREVIAKLAEDNLEVAKKTQQPFF
jgi:hypothetical protein